MLLAMARDVRVILIKLADRLHNMRTLDAVEPEKRRRIARETLEIYAPIANRLGLNSIYQELEDLSLQHLYPDRYRVLAKAVKAARGNRREVVGKVLDAIKKKLKSARRRGAGARAREASLLDLPQDAREAPHLRAGARRLRLPHHRQRRAGLLPRAGRAARPLQADPRQVQGLHRDPQGERLPVAAHHAVRPVRHPDRGADPHPGDAQDRGGRRRLALALQGLGHLALRAAEEDPPVAAEPARDAVAVGRLGRVPRAPQGRSLPGRGLRVHAQGQDPVAAARRDRGGLRLRRAHRHRQPLRRGEDQPGADAAADRTEERRPRRDHHRGARQAQPARGSTSW